MENRVVSYAQNREDIILSAFFPDIEQGFYVDIGAHDPINDSVTKYFYEKGWHGINVEPNKKFYKLLLADRPNDVNVNVGIADKEATLTYREYKNGDGLSTFSQDMQSSYKKKRSVFTDQYVDHKIPVISLKQLFEQNKVKSIQFLKVDIEGFEFEALVGNDWAKYRPEVICIEANHVFKDWRGLLKNNGYILTFDDGLNEYYASTQSRVDKFSFLEKAISKNILYFQDQEKLLNYIALQKKYGLMLEKQADREHELFREIAYRDAIIAESRRFKNSLKLFLHALDKVILIQINRFNHPKRKHATRNIKLQENIETKSNEQLLKIARENDLRNFYSLTTGSGQFKKQYLFSTLLFLYTFPKKVAKLTIKKTTNMMRGNRGAEQ